MTIRYLKIFSAVYETKSTTKAAELLHIAQPSISLAIKELEKYYSVQLFNRISNRLHPTYAGDCLYQHSSKILRDFASMENELHQLSTCTILKLGASTNIGNLFLPNYIAAFKQRFPDIAIHAITDTFTNILDALHTDIIDFALVEDHTADTSLTFIPFMEDRLIFICPPNHALAGKASVNAETLSKYDIVIRKNGTAGKDIFSGSLFNPYTFHIVMECSHSSAVIQAVKNGIGISIMPYLQVKNDIEHHLLSTFGVQNFCIFKNSYVCIKNSKHLNESSVRFIQTNCHVNPPQVRQL